MCGFLGNNNCLHLGTPAIVTLFLAPIREGKSYVALTGKSLRTPGLDTSDLDPDEKLSRTENPHNTST